MQVWLYWLLGQAAAPPHCLCANPILDVEHHVEKAKLQSLG